MGRVSYFPRHLGQVNTRQGSAGNPTLSRGLVSAVNPATCSHHLSCSPHLPAPIRTIFNPADPSVVGEGGLVYIYKYAPSPQPGSYFLKHTRRLNYYRFVNLITRNRLCGQGPRYVKGVPICTFTVLYMYTVQICYVKYTTCLNFSFTSCLILFHFFFVN